MQTNSSCFGGNKLGNISSPVHRIGKIIGHSQKLKNTQARTVAGDLCDRANDMVTEVANSIKGASSLEEKFSLLKMEFGPMGNFDAANSLRPVPQLSPTVIVDFPAFIISIGEAEIESRFCITVCVDERKSKCWQRFSILQNDADITEVHNNFFEITDAIADHIFPTLLNQYQQVLNDFHKDTTEHGANEAEPSRNLEYVYTLDIRSAGSPETAVQDAYQSMFGSSFGSREPYDDSTVLKLFQMLDPDLEELPERGLKDHKSDSNPTKRQLVGYSTYLRPIVIQSEASDEEISSRSYNTEFRAEELDDQIDFTLDSNDAKLNALVALEFDQDVATFLCLGHEIPDSDRTAKRTIAHIISGEISTEYGRLF